MAREVFPFQADREVIEHFLSGKRLPNDIAQRSALACGKGALSYLAYGQRALGTSIAFYAPDGTLQGKLNAGFEFFAQVRAIHYMLDRLEDPRRLTREDHPEWVEATLEDGTTVVQSEAGTPRWQHFFDGAEIELDVPFVIAGALTMAAYRAKKE